MHLVTLHKTLEKSELWEQINGLYIKWY